MTTVKVQYAKTHLSALLNSVEQGDDVVISRGDRPIARLVKVDEPTERPLGFVRYALPESFWDELPDGELSAWEGRA